MILKQKHIQVDIPHSVTPVFDDIAVAQGAVIQECEAVNILVADHSGKFGLSDYIILRTDFIDAVAGIRVTRCLDHMAVSIEDLFIHESFRKCRLIEGYM